MTQPMSVRAQSSSSPIGTSRGMTSKATPAVSLTQRSRSPQAVPMEGDHS